MRTNRLLLRPFTPADAPAMHAIYSDPAVMRWVGYGPVRDLSGTEAMLADYVAHQQQHGFSVWAVVERAGGALIGDAGLHRHGEEVEFGYTLAEAAWGHGYATEAGGAVLDAVDGFGLDGVMVLADAENAASVRVLEKLGFCPAGRLVAYDREHLRFRRPTPARARAAP